MELDVLNSTSPLFRGGGGGTLKVLTHLVIFFQVKGAIGESIIGQGVNIEITQR